MGTPTVGLDAQGSAARHAASVEGSTTDGGSVRSNQAMRSRSGLRMSRRRSLASIARAFASSLERSTFGAARRLPLYMTSRCLAPNISFGA